MRGSVRIEGIPRNRPRGGPSTIPIQALRRISPLRVQCQETEPGAPRRVLDGLHQLSAQPPAAAPAMYQQLRNLRVMRLVRCPGRVELDGADDPFGIASHEEDCTGAGCRNGPSPPVFSALDRERREKAHGSSGLDRVYQKRCERSEIGVAHRRNQTVDHVCLLGHGWLTPAPRRARAVRSVDFRQDHWPTVGVSKDRVPTTFLLNRTCDVQPEPGESGKHRIQGGHLEPDYRIGSPGNMDFTIDTVNTQPQATRIDDEKLALAPFSHSKPE